MKGMKNYSIELVYIGIYIYIFNLLILGTISHLHVHIDTQSLSHIQSIKNILKKFMSWPGVELGVKGCTGNLKRQGLFFLKTISSLYSFWVHI